MLPVLWNRNGSRWSRACLVIVLLAIALPCLWRQPAGPPGWQRGDPELVIITPHNEAIRLEFGRAFSAWHRERHGRPVRIDWRAPGGTTEISRYLTGQYAAAVRAWWTGQHRRWPAGAGAALFDDAVIAGRPADARAEALRAIREALLRTDDPAAFTARIDLFFGGGAYDHADAARKGLTVAPWGANGPPADLGAAVPERQGGETWRTPVWFGAALSTFGICYNLDRLRDLGVARPPAQWADLADPVYFRRLGLADPTKSGSAAKAFEMILQQQCRRAVRAQDYTDDNVAFLEQMLAAARLPPGVMPQGVPLAYQEAVERGWSEGLALIQLIGANARYFSDSASKVPLDVSQGDAVAGLAIDYYARFQAGTGRAPDGRPRMAFVAPAGGTSVSADPISLLRGAEHRAVAVRFMEFLLSEAGQRLWAYRVGTPGGPVQFALCRLPIRRDFYPASADTGAARRAEHDRYSGVALADPAVDPYILAGQAVYVPRWTAQHFGVHRDLIRAMCLDSGDELRAAWRAILAHGGPAAQPEAMRLLRRLPEQPEPLTWRSALDIQRKTERFDYLRAWTACFRRNYREAERLAQKSAAGPPARSGP